jgi:hypothetical protein
VSGGSPFEESISLGFCGFAETLFEGSREAAGIEDALLSGIKDGKPGTNFNIDRACAFGGSGRRPGFHNLQVTVVSI